MNRRYRLLSVHLLAVLLPCAVIGLLGYKWLQLERDAEARRGRDAAEAEASAIRKDLADHLARLAAQVAQDWARQAPGRPPFALPPEPPAPATSAYLLSSEGRLLYPAYETAHRQAILDYQAGIGRPEWQQAMARAEMFEARGHTADARRTLQELLAMARRPALEASALLHLGRLALAEKQPAAAESQALRIFRCCAGARDEFGVSFALYAAAQIASAWEMQSGLRSRFPELAARLAELLQAGYIGHPRDLLEFSALAKRAGSIPDANGLLRQAEQRASQITEHIETAKRLEKWISGSALSGRAAPRFSLTTLWRDEKPGLVGLYRVQEGVLAAVFTNESLAAWVGGRAAERGRFEATLAPAGSPISRATWQTVLWPEAPGLELVLRAREVDPATQQRRQGLFAGALAAAVLLVLLVGYFALRDFSRELQLAGMRSNFVAGVTHELKTPLTSIRMLAETLRLGRTRDPAVAGQLLSTIVDESERLSRLLDNVLTFAKIEKGARAYRRAEIDLPEAVLAAVQRFEYILKQEGFHLATETNGDRLRVNVDGDALGQALLNLLSNAVKYSGESREIYLGIHARGKEAEIRVTDHGIGIPRPEQRRIFENFYRVPETAQDTAGAGLGLALVRHFAEAHGGRITVSSEPGKGSTFSLWLPLAKTVNGGGT